WVPIYSNLLSVNPSELLFVLCCLLVIGITALLFSNWRRAPGLLALWLCYLCLLVPLLGLTEHPHYTSDRYSYLIAGAVSVLISIGLLRVWEQRGVRRLTVSVCLLVGVTCGVLSFKQTFVWQNTVSLFTYWLNTADSDEVR